MTTPRYLQMALIGSAGASLLGGSAPAAEVSPPPNPAAVVVVGRTENNTLIEMSRADAAFAEQAFSQVGHAKTVYNLGIQKDNMTFTSAGNMQQVLEKAAEALEYKADKSAAIVQVGDLQNPKAQVLELECAIGAKDPRYTREVQCGLPSMAKSRFIVPKAP